MEESTTMGERRKTRHVLVLDDPQGRRSIALEAATYSLGRDPSNMLVLRSDYVSRQHAIIFRVPVPGSQTYLFRILDGNLEGKRSTNGLIVNGQKVYSHDLQHGDLIIFSRDVSAGYYVSANLTDAEFARYVDSVEFRSLKAIVRDPQQTRLERDPIPIPPKRR